MLGGRNLKEFKEKSNDEMEWAHVKEPLVKRLVQSEIGTQLNNNIRA